MNAKKIIDEATDPSAKLKLKDRLGHCYYLAGKYAAHNHDATLVHGSIEGFGNPRINHAWCEVDGMIWEPASGKLFDREVYSGVFNPIEAKRYRHEDVLEMTLTHLHWGPWDDDPPKDVEQKRAALFGKTGVSRTARGVQNRKSKSE